MIVGPPGSGKTCLATLGVAYALSKGLFVSVTSLAGKRAYSFGGEHIHRYFGPPVNNNLTPFQQAEFALRKFNHQIERKSLLMRLQVLLVEEITLINAQQWAAMDLILQQLKHSNVPFGGVFIIATHSCQKGKNHCIRLRNGNENCRFPPQPQSHCNWYETFQIDYSDVAFKVMQEIG